MMTRDTHYHPDHPHPDTRDAPLISGLPQGSSNDTYKHKTPGRLSQHIRVTKINNIKINFVNSDTNKTNTTYIIFFILKMTKLY